MGLVLCPNCLVLLEVREVLPVVGLQGYDDRGGSWYTDAEF